MPDRVIKLRLISGAEHTITVHPDGAIDLPAELPATCGRGCKTAEAAALVAVGYIDKNVGNVAAVTFDDDEFARAVLRRDARFALQPTTVMKMDAGGGLTQIVTGTRGMTFEKIRVTTPSDAAAPAEGVVP